jgi:hypothetical protein
MAAFNKDELARLVSGCIKRGLVTVDIVEQAYGTMCELVELETMLQAAVLAKKEDLLTGAVEKAVGMDG